jgi:hypothetical protein
MKPRLLLYLTSHENLARNAVAATLAWAARRAGYFFEVYYDAYRLGEHYGGGDPDEEPAGLLTGGVVAGGHHHERLYLLLHQFETLVVTQGDVLFDSALQQIGTPRVSASTPWELYERVFAALHVAAPDAAIVLDAAPTPMLRGIDAYSYPEVTAREALAFEASTLTGEALQWMREHGVRTLQPLWLGAHQHERLQSLFEATPELTLGAALDEVGPGESFQVVTERLARRCLADFAGGWIVADPLTVSSWLPEAVRERRLAVYGKPQREIIQRLRAELSASDEAVLGRQYEDADFFDLSELGLAFQVIDPARPPFPVLRYAPYDWSQRSTPTSFAASEPDDAQLAQWAREGRILTSVIFWTGMIRELENLPRIVDLAALTGLKAGVVLTVQSLEYQPEAPLALLWEPVARGGVFPLLEPLLGSCGLGVSIESLMPAGRLPAYLAAANRRLDELAIPQALRPTGWWTTMDPDMIALPQPKLPITPTLERGAPFVRLRYTSASTQEGEARPSAPSGEPGEPGDESLSRKRRIGAWARAHGFDAMLAPYRPYEHFAPGDLRADMVETARSAGLRYMFSKAGFGDPPRVLAITDDFIALNYTVGRWDGWTPFETINDIHDLRSAEKRLLARREPGWLVGTLDSCLWTFSGPIWRRGTALHEMAAYLASGGDSGRLINVTPGVVARYARYLAQARKSAAP